MGAMLGGVVFTTGSLVLRADAVSSPTFRNVIQYCMEKGKRKLFFVQECLFSPMGSFLMITVDFETHDLKNLGFSIRFISDSGETSMAVKPSLF